MYFSLAFNVIELTCTDIENTKGGNKVFVIGVLDNNINRLLK